MTISAKTLVPKICFLVSGLFNTGLFSNQHFTLLQNIFNYFFTGFHITASIPQDSYLSWHMSWTITANFSQCCQQSNPYFCNCSFYLRHLGSAMVMNITLPDIPLISFNIPLLPSVKPMFFISSFIFTIMENVP